MAVLTLTTLRNSIITSIYGRRLGLDSGIEANVTQGGVMHRSQFIVGTLGVRLPIQFVGTTVGSTLAWAGTVELATAPSTQTFAAPIPGADVVIFQTSTSTGGFNVRLTNGNFASSTGSSANQISVNGQGASIVLRGLSTALAAVVAMNPPSTGYFIFSTY